MEGALNLYRRGRVLKMTPVLRVQWSFGNPKNQNKFQQLHHSEGDISDVPYLTGPQTTWRLKQKHPTLASAGFLGRRSCYGYGTWQSFVTFKWPFLIVKWPPTIGDNKVTNWIAWYVKSLPFGNRFLGEKTAQRWISAQIWYTGKNSHDTGQTCEDISPIKKLGT